MSEWFVCVCKEACVQGVVQAVSKDSHVWRKRVDLSWGRVKLVVRWGHPVKAEYVQRRLNMCMSVKPWSGEVAYMASMETRVEVLAKLKAEYIKVYNGLPHNLYTLLNSE